MKTIAAIALLLAGAQASHHRHHHRHQAHSDPICSSAGCTQYKHKKTPLGYPINYPVPNNGVDADVENKRDEEVLEKARLLALIRRNVTFKFFRSDVWEEYER